MPNYRQMAATKSLANRRSSKERYRVQHWRILGICTISMVLTTHNQVIIKSSTWTALRATSKTSLTISLIILSRLNSCIKNSRRKTSATSKLIILQRAEVEWRCYNWSKSWAAHLKSGITATDASQLLRIEIAGRQTVLFYPIGITRRREIVSP